MDRRGQGSILPITSMSGSPRLGGRSALLVFVCVLAAYVVESQLTQVSSTPEIESDLILR